MDSDKLKRHSLIHKDLLSLPGKEVKKELRVRHTTRIEREAKRQQIEEIARARYFSSKRNQRYPTIRHGEFT